MGAGCHSAGREDHSGSLEGMATPGRDQSRVYLGLSPEELVKCIFQARRVVPRLQLGWLAEGTALSQPGQGPGSVCGLFAEGP